MTLILSYIGCFISLLLSFFLFSVRSPHRLSNRLFGSFLLLTAIEISAWFSNNQLAAIPSLLMLRITSGLLQTPLFFLYVVSVCRSDFKISRKDGFHLLPFIVANLLLAPSFYLRDHAYQVSFLLQFPGSWYDRLFVIMGHLQFIAYFIAIFLALRRYKTLLLENQSRVSTQAYHWLFQLSIILCVVHGIIIIKNLLNSQVNYPLHSLLTVIVSFNTIFVLSWFTLKALYQPELFKGMPADLPTVRELINYDIPAYEPSPVKAKPAKPATEINNEMANKLREYFETEKPYLDPDLTIHLVATALQASVKELSICINHQLGIHFFDFVNEYRIRYAMTVLADPDQKNKTVLEILYEAGFNSKSSFHAAFMKHSTLTPTQYRKNALENVKKS